MYAYRLPRAGLICHSPVPFHPLPGGAQWNRFPARRLDRALRRHPMLTLAGAMVLTGGGMVAAVTLATALLVLPLSLLLRWI